MKLIFSWLSGFIKILIYLEKASTNESNLCMVVASTNRSMCENGKLLLEQAFYRLVKFMHTLYLNFFIMKVGLAIQLGYFTTLIDLIFKTVDLVVD